jgi:hypothetical protein
MPTHPRADLSKILDDTRPAIEAGLAQAQLELAALDARRQELLALIARGHAALGEYVPAAAINAGDRLTLHQAMELVLDENNNRWMTVHELADTINARGLYEKRDRSQVEASQIHARANKYPGRFAKDGPRIRRVHAEA